MVISTDTSFLFSLYGNDIHTVEAVDWCIRNSHAISISSLNHFELINALRFAEFRKTLKCGGAMLCEQLFNNAICEERIVEITINLSQILTEASRLSHVHTLTGGHRGFDILLVASAKIIGATHFLTFDANQKRLAEAEGLIVPL